MNEDTPYIGHWFRYGPWDCTRTLAEGTTACAKTIAHVALRLRFPCRQRSQRESRRLDRTAQVYVDIDVRASFKTFLTQVGKSATSRHLERLAILTYVTSTVPAKRFKRLDLIRSAHIRHEICERFRLIISTEEVR